MALARRVSLGHVVETYGGIEQITPLWGFFAFLSETLDFVISKV